MRILLALIMFVSFQAFGSDQIDVRCSSKDQVWAITIDPSTATQTPNKVTYEGDVYGYDKLDDIDKGIQWNSKFEAYVSVVTVAVTNNPIVEAKTYSAWIEEEDFLVWTTYDEENAVGSLLKTDLGLKQVPVTCRFITQ